MNKKTEANFFIIGAPKAGTTAMSVYLEEHPEVFFSNPKEPHFFNDDFSFRHTYSFEKYRSYFSEVKDHHKAIGEGSVFYLYSQNAVTNILKYNPDAKFIVMLRNPIELAYSWHSQAIHSFGEKEFNFEKAWRLCEDRRKGKYIPSSNLVREALYYDQISMMGDQVERLLSKVKKENVHFIIFDHFKNDVASEYQKLLIFLGLKNWMPDNFQVINSNKNYKNSFIKKFLSSVIAVKQKLKIKKSLSLGLIGKLDKANTSFGQRDKLESIFEEELKNYYKSDVLKLSFHLKTDLNDLWGIK